MDPVNYYITTLSTAFTKLLPYFIFLVGGYFVFVRLPFLFFRKSMDVQKKNLQEEDTKGLEVKRPYGLEDYQAFQRQMKLMNGAQRQEREQERPRSESKKEESKKEEPKKEEPKREKVKVKAEPQGKTPEEIFNLKPHETITKGELKKRYFELLKQNHPDRVASLGQDFKKLAEKNTKEINKAYEKLKNRAA